MTSAIDATKPTAVTALTADVRANFATAAAEISALQTTAATFPQNLFDNLSLACSIAGNALTIAVKTAGGGDPSTASPVRIAFRNASAATGNCTVIALTTANSLVISSGSTMGVNGANSVFRLWIVAFNDGGIVRLGAINCVNTATVGVEIFRLGDFPISSTLAEGGVGTASSALVFYTSVALTNKPYTILGYADFLGLAVLGAWNTTPAQIQLFGPNALLPGATIQSVRAITKAMATGTTIIPFDDTPPLITEGDQIFSTNFSSKGWANVGTIEAHVACSSNSGASTITLSANDNLGAQAFAAAAAAASPGADKIMFLRLGHAQLIGVTTLTSVKLRIGADIASTTTVNGVAGARKFGGVLASWMELREIMG